MADITASNANTEYDPDALQGRLDDFRDKKDAAEWEEISKDVKTPSIIITAKQVLETKYPEENWLIDRFLPQESITLIVGEAGTFKSYLSLYICKVLSTSELFLGEFEIKQKAKILILDKENKLRRIQKRLNGLSFPTESDVYFLTYPEQFMFKTDNVPYQEVVKFIEDNQIDLIILDSFIDMFEGNENSSTDTAAAFNSIRSMSKKSSFIVLHHDSKPQPNMIRSAAQKTRGSSNIIAQVDYQYYLEKSKEMKSFTIEQGKARDGEPLPRFTVRIESTLEEGITDFIYAGEFKEEGTKVMESKEIIYQFVKSNPNCTKDDINVELLQKGISPRTGKNGLLILMKDKLIDYVERPGHGRKHFYFVIEEENPEEDSEII
jgi:archaellum biogenesis ATPase FlaH